MDEPTTAPAPGGWRKRHPVLSRAILYGMGLLLLGGAAYLLLERSEVDRQDRVAYLNLRLDALDLVLGMQGGETQALAILDEEFRDPELPVTLHHRILRVEAQVRSRMEEWERALTLIDEADRLEVGPAAREASRIERAEVLARAGRLEEALDVMEPEAAASATPMPRVLQLLRAMELAYLYGAKNRPADGHRVLDEALAALPRPLPSEEPVAVGVSRQQGPIVVITATQLLASMAPAEGDPEPWRRLLALAPDTFEAAAFAAMGLRSSGREAEARRAWARAEALNPRLAAAFRARYPGARDLQDSLKNRDPGGR